jgi:hypothetical protein
MKTIVLMNDATDARRLRTLVEQIRRNGHQDVGIVVQGAGPNEVEDWEIPVEFCDRQESLQYLNASSPELARFAGQDGKHGALAGLLTAWERRVERVVLLGDGCSIGGDDFIGGHGIVGQSAGLKSWTGERGWYNSNRFWETADGTSAYPRGFPMEERERGGAKSHERMARVAANVGYGAGQADVDATTSVERKVVVRGTKEERVALAPGTWTAFGADNLGLSWEMIPAYFVCHSLGNYGAIWGSFLLQRIAGHLGQVVSFGRPGVTKTRENEPWRELDSERPGMRRSGELARALRSMELVGGSAAACIGEIAAQLPKAWPAGSLRGAEAWSGYEVEWRRRFLEGLALWVEALEALRAKAPAGGLGTVETKQTEAVDA